MCKILSVIIPAYNSGKFLKKCLDSLICPAVMDQLEVLVVNDGSTDGGERICEAYMAQYPQVFRLLSKENGGHGSAINVGAAAATGKYMKVLDADDWVLTKSLPDYIKALEATQAQVVLTHHHTIDITTGAVKSWKTYPPQFGVPYTLAQVMETWKNFDRSLTFHGITYLLSFYMAQGMLLSERVFYEDHEYATIPACYAQSIVPLDLFLYEYRIGDVSQSVASGNQVRRIAHTEIVLRRLCGEQQNARELPPGGRDYWDKKIHLLLLSFLVTTLLCDQDRKRGSTRAEAFMQFVKEKNPRAHAMSQKQYDILRGFHFFHMGEPSYRRLLSSKLYNKVRGNHDFG